MKEYIELTMEEAKSLSHSDVVWYIDSTTPKPVRFRVTGKVKVWKRDASRVDVPIKHGLYTNGRLTECNIRFFHKEVVSYDD